MSCKIKICGITNLDDALAALEAGADYLGLIFAQSSPRRVESDMAKEIIAGVSGRAQIVGVFKDQDIEYVSELAISLKLDYVQCHGKETVEYVRRLPAKVIKVLELEAGASTGIPSIPALVSISQEWTDDAHFLLFDRPKLLSDPDWYRRAVEEILCAQPLSLPYFFAGGLSAENVGEVVGALQPFAVDVASSVESSPGKKDISKMNDFCNAVKRDSGGVSACAH